MPDDAATPEKTVPPYVSWKTFTSFINHLSGHGVPSVVDRSTMGSMSGSSQSQLQSTLRFLGLVQATGTPTDALRSLCEADDAARKAQLRDIVLQSYRETLAGIDLKRTTTGELTKRFQAAGITGSTITTAISFLLSAAKETGIEVSGHVKPPRVQRKRSNGGTRKRGDRVQPETPEKDEGGESAVGDVQHFPIPLPQLGVQAGVTLPLALDAPTWRTIQTIINAYADALIQQNADGPDDDEPEDEL